MSDVDDFMTRMHAWVDRHDRSLASALARHYSKGWRAVNAEIQKLEMEYREMIERGEAPSVGWLYQSANARKLLEEIRARLTSLQVYAQDEIEGEMRAIIVKALEPAVPSVAWSVLDPKAVEIMVGLGLPGSPLRKLLASISAEGWREAWDALVEGIMLGQSPKKAAIAIRKALGIQLNRALTIARTEMMRALRLAASENYKANSQYLKGWMWHAKLDDRTCFACVMMHGRIFPLSKRMESHPNCRCAMSPVTDLSRAVTTGEQWFRQLPDERQQKLMGKLKWLEWHHGRFTLGDMLKEMWNPVWGRSVGVKSLNELLHNNDT